MNPLHIKMLSALVGAAIALAASVTAVPARAEAFAQSILVIDNLRLRHAKGRPYGAGEFSLLAGVSLAHASGTFDSQSAIALQFGVAGGANDVLQQGAGAGWGRTENDFRPRDQRAATGASFGSADHHISGSMINADGGSGALIGSRADAALAGPGAAAGSSGLSGVTTFSFALGAADYLTISFGALAFSQAYAGAGAAGGAGLAWSISVHDLAAGTTVFTFAPEQLNAMSHVSRSGSLTGATIYDPGWLSFSASTGLLTAGDTYQVTIAQSAFASAVQPQQVAEPGTLAAFGAGLLAMAALSRRRFR